MIVHMGACRGGRGQTKGSRDGSYWAGFRGRTPVRVWGRSLSPRGWQHVLKIIHTYFVYGDFRQHLQHKNTLHFQGRASAPPPCPCLLCVGAHDSALCRVLLAFHYPALPLVLPCTASTPPVGIVCGPVEIYTHATV